jgi:hypothetical protein
MKSKKKIESMGIGVVFGILFFLFFGTFTAVISNPFFIRMTPVGLLEWFSLITTSILLGVYLGFSHYIKKNNLGTCSILATSGGILGFLTFGCSVCNQILVLLLGVSGVLQYFEPLRPFLAIVSIVFLVYANYNAYKIINTIKK